MNGLDTVKAGELVASKTFKPITRHRLALYCGASGDHNPIHVDLDFARASGFPDVFSHGMLAMAWLSQALTDTIAPDRLRSLSARFVAITQLCAELTCTARMVERVERGGETIARLELQAVDQDGDVKLVGQADVAL